MPQFQFSATDRMGNTVEGAVQADDMGLAADAVRQMGYAPVRLEAAPMPHDSAELLPIGSLSAPPVASYPDTTQYQTPIGELQSPTPLRMLLNDEPEVIPERQEPWMRGGPIEQPVAPAPLVTLNANGVPVAAPRTGALAQSQTLGGMTQGQALGTGTNTGPTALRLTPEARRTAPGKLGAAQDANLWTRFKQTMIYPVWSGVVLKDLAPFYRQFATLINAGLPLFQALAALESNTKNPKLKEVAREAQLAVQNGGRVSEVMARYPWIFSAMQVEMIRASELGGMMDVTLHQVADYVEHDLEIRRLISRETAYPKIVLFMALMILGRPGFAGGLPAVSQFVLGGMGKAAYSFADYLRDTIGFGLLVAVPFLAVVAICRLFLFNVDSIRESYDHLKMGLPGIGGLVRMFATGKFCRTFAALYRGGFTMSEALEISGNACGNAVLRKAAHRAIPEVERGGLASDALRAGGMFTPMTVDMVRTGETTGNLDMMMDKVADFYESEAKTKSHMTALIFSTAVFLIIALIVANSIISQWTAIGNSRVDTGAADE